MKIGGVLKFSTLDYPGKLSAIAFCQGCSIRCVYCHNPDFQDVSKNGAIEFQDFLRFLETRKGLLDAVVFSGGDPLLQPDLLESVMEVKKIGFLVGIHTAGVIPLALKKVLPELNWVGFDIKTSFENYEKITQVPNSGNLAKESLDILLKSGVDFEVRTTFDSRNILFEDLENIAKYLQINKIKKWVLQECILREKSSANIEVPFINKEQVDILSKYCDIQLRRQ